jgi:hypothetical protein
MEFTERLVGRGYSIHHWSGCWLVRSVEATTVVECQSRELFGSQVYRRHFYLVGHG